MKTSLLRSISALLAMILVLLLPGSVFAADLSEKDWDALYRTSVWATDAPVDCAVDSLGSSAGAGNGTVTNDLASFIDAYGQMAFNVGKKNGIPYNAILAQASLESGNGQSGLTKQANNFFGIKAASNWSGQTISMPTKEEVNGSLVTVNAVFEAYPTPEAGFQGYVDFLKRNPRYADAFNHQHDPVGYFQSLKNAGYATDSAYVSKLSAKLDAVNKYIASKGVLTPEAQVVYDVAPGGGGGGTAAGGTPAAGAPTCSTSTASGNGSSASIVSVALAQLGNHYQPYTDGRGEEWCADFLSWVYKNAGKPFVPTPGVAMVNGWQIPAVSQVRKYLETKGQFFPKSATAPAPQPGDIVIYGDSHTNLVVEANGYMVKTVGGNQDGTTYSNSVVSESKGAFDIRNDQTVTGWGRLP